MSTDWSTVRHFTAAEWVTDPARVNPRLVALVDELRYFIGHSIVIHVAWEPAGHVEDSTHYDGDAVDLHIVGLDLVDQWLAAERLPFNGIGLYPAWNTPGLHLDVATKLEHPDVGRRWWRDASGAYRRLDRAFVYTLVAPAPGAALSLEQATGGTR